MNLLERKLSRIDLNLLVSLSALLKEKNVSKAAESLYLSQSAMSRTLQRLRDLFDDPLFYRTAKGISPTVRAQELEQLLPNILEQLNHLIESKNFDPLTCDINFSISVPPLMSSALLSSLINKLAVNGPNVCISELPAIVDPLKKLQSGQFDFAINIMNPNDATFSSTYLGKATPVIYARKDHPLTNKHKVSLVDCLNYTFNDLIIETDSDLSVNNPIEKLLLEQGIERKVVHRSTQVSALLEIMRTTNSLLLAPSVLINAPEISDRFEVVFEFDHKKSNTIDIYLIEHQRVSNSQAHQWLKEQLIESMMLS